MKIHLVPAAAGLVLLAGVGVATADQVIITPEQQTVVREYVQRHPLASISLLGVELNVGSTLPDTVELHPIDVPDVEYRYVVVDDRTVLVDPGTRRIVQVID
ncbi:MAG: DUF1236 domain-containing protein [Mesorhizobium sp.]|uniref:DUF1236 domain-containing protein n=1 Tax=unclassified Mesorhizobium TaxID=325217 RepID=UPI000FD2E724|nr:MULTISPECIES: DUF1236 domain-containing protein [unclassified Mesorhizobium]RUU48738.1 DUF1236 domain-containing protein [Mesorhizobium sp. M6A.T.Ca.TU.002.02.2.1]RUU98697.1 DUF1236 domain-containing protein [Mesorhizobium sp. M6A.T.Cr.TU.017.01.1.1]RVB77623.1 DUF1236 domain-containing protein [Mesorhizobium sp. M6A.T.Cr.TU.014.01.1.1]RWN24162.1 MAG: DUF1236 domain-containing protein [Mesorhizobium sp.]RWN65757.1 MAG: DUF1236 domain-containing protein [Mesorhizobium sp.]